MSTYWKPLTTTEKYYLYLHSALYQLKPGIVRCWSGLKGEAYFERISHHNMLFSEQTHYLRQLLVSRVSANLWDCLPVHIGQNITGLFSLMIQWTLQHLVYFPVGTKSVWTRSVSCHYRTVSLVILPIDFISNTRIWHDWTMLISTYSMRVGNVHLLTHKKQGEIYNGASSVIILTKANIMYTGLPLHEFM